MIIKQKDRTVISKQVKVNYLFFLGFLLLFLTSNVCAQDDFSGYKISSPITGIVKAVYVRPGQTVKKGDILIEFDADLIASDLSEAKAKMTLEKLNTSEAKKEFERAEELYDRTVLSEQELQQAKISYTKALAQNAAAKNHLVHAQWNLDQTKLIVNISGKVSHVYSYPGQFVNNKLIAQTLMLLKP